MPPAARTPVPGRAGNRRLTALLAGVFAAAGAVVLLALNGPITPSSDPGAPSTHVAWGWLAAALAVGLCWTTSRGVTPSPATAGARIRTDVAVLIGCAGAFPLVMQLPVWLPEDYVWLKALILLGIPALTLGLLHRRVGPGVRFERPDLGPAVMVGALAGIALHQYLTQLRPGAPSHDFSNYDLTILLVSATATALTAGIGEEIFYRYWLQTRLEALLGRWPGILLASLLFGLMHVASHRAGLGWGFTAAVVIAGQGVAGILCGYLWSRYRRLWMPILLHLSMNGLMVVLYLTGPT